MYALQDGIYDPYDIDDLDDRAGARAEHMSIDQELEHFRKQWREELYQKRYIPCTFSVVVLDCLIG